MSVVLRNFLQRFVRLGDLEVEMACGASLRLGDGSGPAAAIKFKDPAAQWRLLLDPEMAVGELFMDGGLIVTRGAIFDVLTIATRNVALAEQPRWLASVQQLRGWLKRWGPRNTPVKAKKNVERHYDIDSRIYELFLDSDWQYSCAYFETADQSLEQSQLAKKRHIAAKLLLEPGQRVLDIGCGWGGLALYLAQACDAHITGITLSREQLAIARMRSEDLNLASKAAFVLTDYRDVDQTFDRIVSVGMFEHVGLGHYDAFFECVAKLLSDDGVALIHTIGNNGAPMPTAPWIVKYIFPGGYIPSLSEILPSIERAGLIVSDVEILRLHYAETLRHWRERFMARRAEAEAVSGEKFCRMWEFYLSLCEAAFRVGINSVFQIQLVKKVDAAPLTRDYIDPREGELRANETGMAEAR
jgi:cyclopropane-fatty-acyl-phospholipid synthase